MNNNKLNNEYSKYKNNRKKIIFKLLDSHNEIINSSEKIAIIIPHRNRLTHLKIFEKKILELNNNINGNLDIYVIDQNNGDKFNRGFLLNIGYVLAKLKKKYSRYIFHDVDSYPDKTLFELYFQHLDKNIHFASPYLGYKYNFDNFFGGVNSFTSDTFEKINGYPNNFFGWGGEDDAIYNRAANNNILIFRPTIGSYILEEHEPPKPLELNNRKKENILEDLKKWHQNGVKQIKNLFINIKEYNNIDKFIELYDKENSNITNGAILFETFSKNEIKNTSKSINWFFYKIDYLSKHNKFYDYILDKDYVKIAVEKKIKDLQQKGQPFFQHKNNPTYISVIEPLIYWSEIEEKIINTYTNPKKFTNKKIETNNISKLKQKIKKLVIMSFNNYKLNLTKTNLFETIKHIFNNYNELLYFRIRKNKIECAYHLYNPSNNTDWYEKLKYKQNGNIKNIDESYQEINDLTNKEYFTLRKPHFIPANNCLLGFDSYNYFEGNPTGYISEFKEMLEYTINLFHNVPDCDILINRKDFAYINKDGTFAYDQVVNNKQKYTDLYQNNINPFMVGSQSITNSHQDIPIPSADEWKDIFKYSNIKIPDWNSKKNIGIFRGSSTGCSTEINTNPRLKLADISNKWNNIYDKKDLIDVKINALTSRPKSYNGFMGVNNFVKYKYLLGKFMDIKEQLNYKYIFNIQGNAQAYRFPNEFKKHSVILNIKSEYKMWFEPLINSKHFVEIESDFSNLYDKIMYLKNNDSIAEKIAINGFNFSNKYITKNSIATYWFFYMYYTNKHYNN
jgi:hypothetical protein